MRKVGLLSKVLGNATASFAKYFVTKTIASAAYARVLVEGLNRGRHPPAGKDSFGWFAFEDEDARVVSLFINCLMELDVGYRHLITHFLGGQRTFGGGVKLLFPRLKVVCTHSGVISRRDRIIEIPNNITQERQMTDAIISSAGLAASQT
jgi:hypothetical protein